MSCVKKRKHCSPSKGFTLMEVMFSIVIVGIAIVSLMMLFAAGTKVNAYGNELSTAVFLADQLRAMTDQINFIDLLAYDDNVFNGVDADGNPVPGMQNFQQTLDVLSINPDDLTVYVGPDPEAVILKATVSKAGNQITQISWLRVR